MTETYSTTDLRFVRRKVQFDDTAEPAFRLVLQQKCYESSWEADDSGEWVKNDELDMADEAPFWADVPIVNEEE
jgi:uncharacterized protein YfaS (alpha-2-macroglobulin family)